MPRNSRSTSVPGLFEEEQTDMLEKSFQEAQKERAKLPVECLGIAFPNDLARREHFLGLLAEKLKDPAFRQIEGFPVGKDEDILALSDPPYYTACPNPWLEDFVNHFGTPYDSKKQYHRKPYVADVSEGKTHPIYLAHSYHTKVPHRAIMRYILHYTEPGDLVFDGFAGTGMTGVAAALCGNRGEIQALEARIEPDGSIVGLGTDSNPKIGARRAVLNDLSPVAAFIAYNYNSSADSKGFEKEANKVLREIESEVGWMYKTTHTNGESADINFTVWSDVFSCPECGNEIIFWDDAVTEGDVKDEITCPHCTAQLTKKKLQRLTETDFDHITKKPVVRAKRKPVLINYTFGGARFTKKPDESDLALVAKIASQPLNRWFPNTEIPQDSDLWKERDYSSLGIFRANDFYSRRNLIMCAVAKELIMKRDGRMRGALWFWFQSVLMGFSLVNRYLKNAFSQVNRILSGTLYVGAMQSEVSPRYALNGKIRKHARLFGSHQSQNIVATSSAEQMRIPDSSIDYIFLDPPFGSNIIYSDLSFLWEAWLGVTTRLNSEAVVHRRKKKDARSLEAYADVMRICFSEAFRILKPGRWITVEFSNTRATVWNSIQIALEQAGFVVANVSALDKKMGSFKAVTTPTAVKQDLVISAYKPNGGLEARFANVAEKAQGSWEFVRSHLKYLPVVKQSGGEMEFIAERDPRIIFDRMVAFYFQHGVEVPMNSAEFQAGLAQNFIERDGMYFLSEQATEYERKKQLSKGLGQRPLFIDDERSAIEWLRHYLKQRPSEAGHLTNEFNAQIRGSTWRKGEVRPELRDLLRLNFLCYNGTGDVPNQIHSYLSTNYKEYRSLSKSDPLLQAKAKDCWFVPDPNNAIQLEQIRERELLRAFDIYRLSKERKITEFRIEALRAGFKKAWQEKDYQTIIAVAAKIPQIVIQEDPKLLMWHSNACTRAGVDQ